MCRAERDHQTLPPNPPFTRSVPRRPPVSVAGPLVSCPCDSVMSQVCTAPRCCCGLFGTSSASGSAEHSFHPLPSPSQPRGPGGYCPHLGNEQSECACVFNEEPRAKLSGDLCTGPGGLCAPVSGPSLAFPPADVPVGGAAGLAQRREKLSRFCMNASGGGTDLPSILAGGWLGGDRGRLRLTDTLVSEKEDLLEETLDLV